jgi:hypothetical protein
MLNVLKKALTVVLQGFNNVIVIFLFCVRQRAASILHNTEFMHSKGKKSQAKRSAERNACWLVGFSCRAIETG